MKIALVGPGILPIPPNGWGAVERLIFDYHKYLVTAGHKVDIINTPNRFAIIKKVNDGNYDFVHVHYDCFVDIMPKLKAKALAITSHYPYIDQLDKHAADGYDKTFKMLCENDNFTIFADSLKDLNTFQHWVVNKKNLKLLENCIDHTVFKFYPKAQNDKILCLGKLEYRKRQGLLRNMGDVDIVGRDTGFWPSLPNYIGEWTDEEKYEKLGQYKGIVLLSLGENGTPLVLKEAMICGLPVLTTKYAASEILNTPGVVVIEEADVNQPPLLRNGLNLIHAIINSREDIRDRAIAQFSFAHNINKYIKDIQTLCNAS